MVEVEVAVLEAECTQLAAAVAEVEGIQIRKRIHSCHLVRRSI